MSMDRASLAKLARQRSRWRDHEPRTYVEAFPRLNIVQCAKAAADDRNFCLWECDGVVVAGAAFRWRSNHGLHVNYHHQPERGLSCSGQITLAIAYVGSMDHNQRALVRCPLCSLNRSAVVLKDGAWACRRCHGLGYRSALVGTAVRRAEKLTRLEAELEVLERGFYPARRCDKKRGLVELARRLAGKAPFPVAHERFAYQLETRFTEVANGEVMENVIYDRLPLTS